MRIAERDRDMRQIGRDEDERRHKRGKDKFLRVKRIFVLHDIKSPFTYHSIPPIKIQ